MIVLLGIGFVAGVITAISPCVLPVLPIILAGGASGGRRRPYAIIAGLVASFTVFTLVAAQLLDLVGLPQSFLRNVAIALLFVVAATLLVPKLGELAERPFLRLTRRRSGDLGGGFLLGASLGLVFVPCAGPILSAVTVISATHRVGLDGVLLTLAYALGAAVPMLLIALGGRGLSGRMRAAGPMLRRGLGALVAVTAIAIAFHLDTRFQTSIPGYTNALQKKVEDNGYARKQIQRLTGAGRGAALAANAPVNDFGPAPQFAGISHWLNTPGERPLTMRGLRGKVVLIDFWTYSCINCLRTLPHVEGWYSRYAQAGFVVVGVHTPEFAFEHDLGNVRSASRRLGVKYPVALDNDYDTWNAYSNQYWPAKYLIDRRGHVRHAHFGEGEYDRTESLIRTLLAEKPGVRLPARLGMPDTTPHELVTPESYLGFGRLDRYNGSPIVPKRAADYRFARSQPPNELSYAGRWRVESERIVSVDRARLRLQFRARHVYLVLGGRGAVQVLVDGRRVRTVSVTTHKLYTLLSYPRATEGLLELRFSRGIEGYAFTFG